MKHNKICYIIKHTEDSIIWARHELFKKYIFKLQNKNKSSSVCIFFLHYLWTTWKNLSVLVVVILDSFPVLTYSGVARHNTYTFVVYIRYSVVIIAILLSLSIYMYVPYCLYFNCFVHYCETFHQRSYSILPMWSPLITHIWSIVFSSYHKDQ